MSTLDSKSVNMYAILLTFTYDTTTIRYIVGHQSITIDSNVYSPEPALEVKLAKEDGTTDPKIGTITSKKTIAPFDIYKDAEPSPQMGVVIAEVDINDTSTIRTLVVGEVTKVVLNKGRKPNVVEMQVGSPKARLNVTLGILAASECPWVFGDDNCGFNVPGVTESGTVSAINGHEITITGLSGVATSTNRYFHHGYIEFNDVRIMVRRHVIGNVVELMRVPPASWDGATVSAVPGCDKELTTCQNQWNNEESFCGLGTGMPGHHPMFETI